MFSYNEYFYQVYVQLFHWNCIEKYIYIAVRLKLLNLKKEHDENANFRLNFQMHLEVFASELFIYIQVHLNKFECRGRVHLFQ